MTKRKLHEELRKLEKDNTYSKDLNTAIRMRLSSKELSQFKLVAQENGVTMSSMFRMLISDAVKKLKK